MKAVYLFLFCLLFSLLPAKVSAQESNNIVTIVHPMRSRDFWQNVEDVRMQAALIFEKKLPATWLVQYSILKDKEVLDELKTFPKNQEIGIFLEVDEHLATDAKVAFLIGEGSWARADKILLSGYTPVERLRLIDTIFSQYHSVYGRYPASVGAWYIDAVSMHYLRHKYGVDSFMIVSDQFETDGYGVWGIPWSMPYYASDTNPLIPAQTSSSDHGVVIQWAARDPYKGYGLGVKDSTYSVQANDYVSHHGLTTEYFQQLTRSYLRLEQSDQQLRQLTVGLEVGQEGKDFLNEYTNQISYLFQLSQENKLRFQTMSDFTKTYKSRYTQGQPMHMVSGVDRDTSTNIAYWVTTPYYRAGLVLENGTLYLRDVRAYSQDLVFNDVIKRDTDHKLTRIIPFYLDQSMSKIELFRPNQDLNEGERGKMVDPITLRLKDTTHTVTFHKKTIELDGKTLYENTERLLGNPLKGMYTKALVSGYAQKSYVWHQDLRFAKIGNDTYFGIWNSPTTLIGIKSSWPFIGVYEFPFQVLSRFKTLPSIDLISPMNKYFFQLGNHSTIEEGLPL